MTNPKSIGCRSIAMLAELFMLRMEAIARAINPQGTTGSDTRFVPIKLSTIPAKGSQSSPTKSA
jgi:hypothetical protein